MACSTTLTFTMLWFAIASWITASFSFLR